MTGQGVKHKLYIVIAAMVIVTMLLVAPLLLLIAIPGLGVWLIVRRRAKAQSRQQNQCQNNLMPKNQQNLKQTLLN